MKLRVVLISGFFIFLTALLVFNQNQGEAQSQQDLEVRLANLEARLTNIEDYLEKFRPVFADFSKNMLESVDKKMQLVTDKVVILNPVSRESVKIESNVGTILLSIQKMDKTEKGYLLTLNIGNPSAATYGNIKVKMRWGKNYVQGPVQNYDQWRRSLGTSEFEYPGEIEPGTWAEVAVNIPSVEAGQFEHLECEMEVGTIKMGRTRVRPS
ncbi:MAG: DUF3251 domain-containing protein [Candidatus Omnitrophica bacterium]|nr:DUF3251 domain-containing protein [Candidatus Omnitrophota bacterium]